MKAKTILFLLIGICLACTSSTQAAGDMVSIVSPTAGKIVRLDVAPGDKIYSGDSLAIVKADDGTTIVLKAGVSGTIASVDVHSYQKIKKDTLVGTISPAAVIAEQPGAGEAQELPGIGALMGNLFRTTGLYGIIDGQISKDWTVGIGRILMICVGLTLLYLGIFKQFEPLLLIPIGYGAILSNIPLAGIAEPGGILYYVYEVGIVTG
ncbi:MAG: sodium ion-translocating decarboxylase subunit beta, partial [Desulfofustis sp.]